jgi:spore maturation protein CgeB
MKFVIFGLTISSSWGNGHATLWRGLCRSLANRGHRVIFFEHDVAYYASHRDYSGIPGVELCLYENWNEALPLARRHLSDAEIGMVTSYCPDGIASSELVLSSSAALRIFYDLDAPVTLERLKKGLPVEYIGPRGLGDFDLVLSFTGGVALKELRTKLGARIVAPLYGSVDPAAHYPVPAMDAYRADLSYLGTYAEDRQTALLDLFIETSRKLPERRFLLGGSMYPESFPWTKNIFFVKHISPPDHPAFYCSSLLTLNVTRRAMADMGFCPSGRLFEAAACGVPILSDVWDGLDQFFNPGSEILTAQNTDEAVGALSMPLPEIRQIAKAARERTMDEHTAEHRAIYLENILDDAYSSAPAGGV